MKRTACVLFAAAMMAGCAATDVSNYSPPMDPDLVTANTPAHVSHCDSLVNASPPARDWKSYIELGGSTSLTYWVSALMSPIGMAITVATGATAFGTGEAVHNDNNSRQSGQESRVRQCLANYHEPLTEKP